MDAFKNLAVNHPSLVCIEFYDSEPVSLSGLPGSFDLDGTAENEDVVNRLEDAAFVELAGNFPNDEDREILTESTDCDRVVVTPEKPSRPAIPSTKVGISSPGLFQLKRFRKCFPKQKP